MTEVTATMERTEVEATVSFRIIGAPDFPVPYSRTKRMFSPEHGHATFRVVDGRWALASVSIGGRIRLKDGGLGTQSARNMFASYRAEPELPEWLQPIADQARVAALTDIPS